MNTTINLLSGLKLEDFVRTLVENARIRNCKVELFSDDFQKQEFAVMDATIELGQNYTCFNRYRDYIVNNYRAISSFGRTTIQIYLDDPYLSYDKWYSEAHKFKVKRVMINGPATIVFWEDGTKTVAKCLPEDKFDFEKGIALCFMKKATKESCVKIFEDARKDNLKNLMGELEKLNKELEKKKCSENTEGTPT